MNVQVAIDGPAGAGKSTVARLLARRLGVAYVDTGAMYRCLALLSLRRGIAPGNAEALAELARTLRIRFAPEADGQRVWMFDDDVTAAIRSEEVGGLAPAVAGHAAVREWLVESQKQLAARNEGIVMDGRDIGTAVLPAAPVKIFLTASLAVRAQRRFEELTARGFAVTPAQVRALVEERDRVDGTRSVSPLRAAADAVILDTTCLTPREAVAMIAALCAERAADRIE